jgi:Uncharacterized protein conserved in bacteria (DUF2066)
MAGDSASGAGDVVMVGLSLAEWRNLVGSLSRVGLIAVVCAVAFGSQATMSYAASSQSVFTMGGYPVEASAKDAVTAREKAVAEGQKAAFRSLLKRLVPVTSYARLRRLSAIKVGDMLDGVAVKSERNSTTDYLANLDFIFQPQAVRALLQREGLKFVDAQAPLLVVVPIWKAEADTATLAPQLSEQAGSKAWRDAWASLDLTHALTPIRLENANNGPKPAVVSVLATGDVAPLRQLLLDYKSETLVFAIAEPDVAKKRLHVTLVGRDEVGDLGWRRSQRLDLGDSTYSVAVAAVVSLGVIEGRWKAMQLKGGRASAPLADIEQVAAQPERRDGATETNLRFGVEFQGMAEWQSLSRKLSETPGVEDVDVAGLSARGARVSLRFQGTMRELADVLGRQGMALRQTGAGWVMSAQ